MTFSPLKSYPGPGAWAGLVSCGLWLVLLGLSFVTLSPLPASGKTPPPQVIILNSYHPGFSWSDEEVAGVLQELRSGYPNINPAIEYLDTKRFPSDTYLLKVKDYLASKYRDHKFALVIVLDNPALKMVLADRQELFPESPIVFAGINNFKPAMLSGQKQVTGVAESLDTEGTLKTALALHPETTEIFMVTDYTLSGKATRQEITAAIPRLPATVHIKFAPPATMAELREQIKRLPATAIIFISGFTTDTAGQSFSPAETGRLLSRDANLPVYIVHEARLGQGPVGGILLAGKEEGRRAGEIALRVLAGADPSSIPVDTKSTARPMFDYRQLTRFKIPLSALPKGSIIINRPSSFYEIHRSLVWGTSGVVLALVLVVIALGVNISRRRRTEMTLRESEERFRSLVENIDLGIILIDRDYRIAMVNSSQEKLFQKPAKDFIGQECFREFEKREKVCSHCPGTLAMATGKGAEVEASVVREDGTLLISRLQAFPRFGPDGEITGFIEVVEDITDKKQAEEALRRSEEKYRLVFEKAPLGIMHYDLTSTITQCNTKFTEIIGAPQERLVGFNMILKLQDEKLREAVNTSLKGEVGYYEGDYLSVTAEKLTPIRAIFQPLASPEGALSGGVAIVEDITERRRAEEALRKSEAGLANAQRIVHLGNWEWDIQQNVVSWSDEIYRIFGVAPQGIGANFKSFLKMVHPGDRHLVKQALATSLYHRQPYNIAHRVVLPSGSVRFVQGMGEVAFDAAGRPLRLVGTLQDITDRMEAVAALQEHLHLFQTLIDTIPSPIFYKNVEGIYLGCNRALADFLGLTKEEIIGKSVYDMHPRDLADRYFEMDSALFRNPGVQIYDFSMMHADGTRREVNFNKATYATADGTLAGLVGVMIDITDRKKAEAERLHFSKLESLGTLAGGIAHDFNNILTVILGNISLAMLDQTEAMIRKRLTAADRACLQAQTLAQQLLTFARGGTPIKELVSVAELVSEAGYLACTGSNVKCDVTLPSGLWAVEADPGQISQVFQNLVINAIQAMPTGGSVEVTGKNLEITARSNLPLDPGKYVKISLHDQGLGIPAEYLPQIFDPYFTTKQRGSGLGLATVYSILQNHLGYITVESELGQGTTFHLYLPASDRQITQPPRKAQEVLTGQGRILLMDDEEMVRETLEKMLKHLGYLVIVAGDGEEAIAKFALARESGQPFDAVILDLTVQGGMGGQEAMQKLLQIDPLVKAVVSSGYSEDSIMAEPETYGFSGVIAKPYRMAELSKALNKVLRANGP